MDNNMQIIKDEENELPIPYDWRQTFYDVVEAFRNNDFELQREIKYVRKVTLENAKIIKANIQAYGDCLISLPDSTWETSIYQWEGGCWVVLIDLYTEKEEESDLALFAKVYETGHTYRFEIQSIQVP